jgi:DNA-binding MurR/RpiR family transcriptional regulator
MDDAEYEKAIDAFCKTTRVFFAGVGISASVAQCASHKCCVWASTAPGQATPTRQLLHATHMNKGDICMLINQSGRTRAS